MTPTGYTEDALGDINPEALAFRVASGLRAWNDSTAETLRLFTRRQGQLVLNIPKEVEV
ncbi:MAG: hypothetical protein KKH02_06750 [Proteobacteria bacterium]|nr:hypothetical protein [Pseudomonadota bacterium]MBU4582093.1 hypothetical protein [Pseudomonadota bacterium]MCG2738615.1 hypothetical protein [Syntrophaceae bacterium]